MRSVGSLPRPQKEAPPAWVSRSLPVARRTRLLAVLAVAADRVERERLAQLADGSFKGPYS